MRIFVAAATCALALQPFSGRAARHPFPASKTAHGPIAVYLDGVKLAGSASAIVSNSLFISLRAVANVLGADVAYNPARKQVTVTTALRQAVFRIGDANAIVNAEAVQLRPPARAIRGRVMLPLRGLARAFDAQISYDRSARKITLVTNASLQNNRLAKLPAARTSTLEGTVTNVGGAAGAPVAQIDAAGTPYTLKIPAGTKIQFRDTHGAIAGEGRLAQLKPGDTLIVTFDPGGRLLSLADVFAATNGAIAAVAGQSMVLTNGKVVNTDATGTSVTLDGHPATMADLRAGDLVTVRADPKTGKARVVVGLRPGGSRMPGSEAAGSEAPGVRIAGVSDDADRPLRAGQTLHVAATGTTGAHATFDLGDIVVANEMREVSPGRYEGSYIAGFGTNLIDVPIVVRLRASAQTVVAEARNPLTVVTQPPQIKDTIPAANGSITATRPIIYATFSTVGDTGMNADSLRMFVNGSDVSAQATITRDFISYYPSADLRAGQTTVEVKGTDAAGNPLDYRWAFTISGR